MLGQGSFAIVKLVRERQPASATAADKISSAFSRHRSADDAGGKQHAKEQDRERALKIVAKKPLKDSNEKMLKEEIAILSKVEHPNM